MDKQRTEIEKRYTALDGLRAIAALLVVLSHFSNRTWLWGDRLGDDGGQIGVMLFFLISGFLMARLYLGGRMTTNSAVGFVQHRFARVVPLYVLVVLASFATVRVFGAPEGMYPVTTSNLASHLLFFDGVDVLWSIPVEIHFYMLFLIIWIIASYLRSPMMAAILFMAAFICLFIPGNEEDHHLFYHLHFFLGGVVVAIAHQTGIIRQARLWDVAFVGLAFGVLLLMPRVAEQLFGVHLDPWKSPVTFAVLTLLLISALGSSLAATVLGGRIGRFGGDISYSVYLWHSPILFWSALIRPANTRVFLIFFLAIVILASWISYRLIERPSRRAINSVGHGPSVAILHST